MRLARGYLRSARGQASILAMAIAVAAAGTTVATGLDSSSRVLAGLEVLAVEAVVVTGIRNALRPRRAEAVTLRVLGWPARQVKARLMLDFAVLAVVVGLMATGFGYVAQALLGGRVATWWPALNVPAALVMVLVAAWWPVRRMTSARWVTPAGWVLTGTAADRGADAALGTLVIGASCATFSLELAVRWTLRGTVAAPWLRTPATWQASAVDLAAAATIAALATACVADLHWHAARDRAAESRTLRALGWPWLGFARLAVRDAVLLGSAGGVLSAVAGLAASVASGHQVHPRMLAVMTVAGVVGILVSLLAGGAAAVAGRYWR